MFHLASPYWLLGLLLLPVLVWWHIRRKPSSMKFTLIDAILPGQKRRLKVKLYNVLHWFEIFVIGVIFLALARPQIGRSYEEITTKGIDIMLVFDISSSTLAVDFPPDYSIQQVKGLVYANKVPHNRNELAKDAAKEFIKGRKNDEIGLVIFSKDAFTQCPLTLDYDILLQFLDQVHIGMLEDGTAIGMGIATALNRLKNSTGKSKIIILLTDGRNNAGKIDPLTAAQLSKALGVKIYAIGAGNKGMTIYPVQTAYGTQYAQMQGEEMDEQQLQQIADATGGLYFMAETPGALKNVYNTIDKLEKTEIKSRRYTLYREIFKYFLMVGFAVLVIQVILSLTFVAKIP